MTATRRGRRGQAVNSWYMSHDAKVAREFFISSISATLSHLRRTSSQTVFTADELFMSSGHKVNESRTSLTFIATVTSLCRSVLSLSQSVCLHTFAKLLWTKRFHKLSILLFSFISVFVSNKDYTDWHCSAAVPERVTFRLCVLAYRCLHGTAPTYLAGAFSGNLMSILDAVCVLLTQPCWSYRPPDVQRSAVVPSQWLRHVRGTACRRLSGMHRRWRRSVASWRLYFFGRRLTMTRRSWLYCTV